MSGPGCRPGFAAGWNWSESLPGWSCSARASIWSPAGSEDRRRAFLGLRSWSPAGERSRGYGDDRSNRWLDWDVESSHMLAATGVGPDGELAAGGETQFEQDAL